MDHINWQDITSRFLTTTSEWSRVCLDLDLKITPINPSQVLESRLL